MKSFLVLPVVLLLSAFASASDGSYYVNGNTTAASGALTGVQNITSVTVNCGSFNLTFDEFNSTTVMEAYYCGDGNTFSGSIPVFSSVEVGCGANSTLELLEFGSTQLILAYQCGYNDSQSNSTETSTSKKSGGSLSAPSTSITLLSTVMAVLCLFT